IKRMIGSRHEIDRIARAGIHGYDSCISSHSPIFATIRNSHFAATSRRALPRCGVAHDLP
ncbi:MAG: hypothetical protein ACXW3N_11350, partial [Rhodoplanes sp.]